MIIPKIHSNILPVVGCHFILEMDEQAADFAEPWILHHVSWTKVYCFYFIRT